MTLLELLEQVGDDTTGTTGAGDGAQTGDDGSTTSDPTTEENAVSEQAF